LLKALFDDDPPKLKLKPPEAGALEAGAAEFDDAAPDPKLNPPLLEVLVAVCEALPKIPPDAGACDVLPKLKLAGVELPVFLFPIENRDFAGDLSSCFMGLPSNIEVPPAEAGGDFGAPNSLFEAVSVAPLVFNPSPDVPPELNNDGAVAVADVVSFDASAFVVLAFPNKGLAAVAETLLPKRLLVVAAAELAPNRLGALGLLAVEPAFANSEGLGSDVEGAFSGSLIGSAGFAPNKVEEDITDGPEAAPTSVGLLAEPKIFAAPVGAFMAEEPKMLGAAGLTASGSFAASVVVVEVDF
jgi:hypothetical protein